MRLRTINKTVLQKIMLTAVLTLVLTGCQAISQPMSAPVIVETPNSQPTLSDPPTVTKENQTAATISTALPAEKLAESGQTENLDVPLRFVFPSPQPPPKSLWRAPLYDVPWALGPHDHFFFVRPIAADQMNWPLADYRYGGIFFRSDIVHTGIDIPTPKGTPIFAAGPGQVMFAGYGLFRGNDDPNDPYGLAVTVRHDFGYQGLELYTVYAHMDRINVVSGQRVETGTQLGEVGTTGLTTGPHLHFEVRMENDSFFTTRNPELWLAPPQGSGVLVGRLLNTNKSLLTRHEVIVKNLETRQKWSVISYGDAAVNSDAYYQENCVLGDLPAGRYQISIDYAEKTLKTEIEIHPGAVSYFSFRGENGFNLDLPREPGQQDWLTAAQ